MGCSICAEIPPDITANVGRDESLPASTHKLRRRDAGSTDDLWECPECRALYLFRDLRQQTGSGNNDDETLTRLSDELTATVRRLLGPVSTEESAPFEDALFELPDPLFAMVFSSISSDRVLLRAMIKRMVFELWRVGKYGDTMTLRMALLHMAQGDLNDARAIAAAIELMGDDVNKNLVEVKNTCARVLAVEPK